MEVHSRKEGCLPPLGLLPILPRGIFEARRNAGGPAGAAAGAGRRSVVLFDEDADAGAAGGSSVAEVREALAGLGYAHDEIRDVLRDLPTDVDSASLLRNALKTLGARHA